MCAPGMTSGPTIRTSRTCGTARRAASACVSLRAWSVTFVTVTREQLPGRESKSVE
jgi:hypothetical protein